MSIERSKVFSRVIDDVSMDFNSLLTSLIAKDILKLYLSTESSQLRNKVLYVMKNWGKLKKVVRRMFQTFLIDPADHYRQPLKIRPSDLFQFQCI